MSKTKTYIKFILAYILFLFCAVATLALYFDHKNQQIRNEPTPAVSEGPWIKVDSTSKLIIPKGLGGFNIDSCGNMMDSLISNPADTLIIIYLPNDCK